MYDIWLYGIYFRVHLKKVKLICSCLQFCEDMGSKILKAKGQEIPEVKTDSVLPAYCNPPNPCPVGYTEADGCIETFENSAAFSRAYQASQDCMCDTEHMFDCPSSRDSDDSAMELSRQNFIAELVRFMWIFNC